MEILKRLHWLAIQAAQRFARQPTSTQDITRMLIEGAKQWLGLS